MAAILELGSVFGMLVLGAASFFAGIWLASAASRLGGVWRSNIKPTNPAWHDPCRTEGIESDRRYRCARGQCVNEELIELEARLLWETPNAFGGG